MTRHKVFNKATGRWVFKTGELGRKIQAKEKTHKAKNKASFPKSLPLFKKVKGGRGERLSAAAYYKLCGSLKKCSPQQIPTPNGLVWKKIALVHDAWGGKCAKWVKA